MTLQVLRTVGVQVEQPDARTWRVEPGPVRAFDVAVEAVAAATHELLDRLVTKAPPKDREVEAAKAKARSEARFAA